MRGHAKAIATSTTTALPTMTTGTRRQSLAATAKAEAVVKDDEQSAATTSSSSLALSTTTRRMTTSTATMATTPTKNETAAASPPVVLSKKTSSSTTITTTPTRGPLPSLLLPPYLDTAPLPATVVLQQVSQHVETAVAYEAHHLPVIKCGKTASHRVGNPESFRSNALITARWLVGARLVRVLPCGTRLSGKIVEVESYLGSHDKGAHSYGGKRTLRLAPMFEPGGVAYIYHIHACSCLNVIASEAEDPVGVLIRALEPQEGVEHMLQNRLTARALRGSKKKISSSPTSSSSSSIVVPRVEDLAETDRQKLLAELCAGPGRLCHALALDHLMSGMDLIEGETLFLERGEHVPASQLVASPRIGIGYAGAWQEAPLRFSVLDNRHVSKPWPWRQGGGGGGGGKKRQKMTRT